MKHNNFSFLVGEGTKAIFKHGFMSFAAVCITVACLVIVTSFGLITYNIGLIVDDLQKENEVLICIDESYTEAEAKSVGSRINLIDNVADARFISREEALQTFVKEYDAVMYDGVTAETMRDQYIVTLEDNSKLQETIDALKQVPGVATIYSDPTVANAMSTIRNVLSIVSACIAAVLLIVSLIIISNTIKLAMFDRREEIAIMRMVGATNGFIRLPFVVEGFILGLLVLPRMGPVRGHPRRHCQLRSAQLPPRRLVQHGRSASRAGVRGHGSADRRCGQPDVHPEIPEGLKYAHRRVYYV